MRRCEFCGAYIDAGERCDCIETSDRLTSFWKSRLNPNEDDQMEMIDNEDERLLSWCKP